MYLSGLWRFPAVRHLSNWGRGGYTFALTQRLNTNPADAKALEELRALVASKQALDQRSAAWVTSEIVEIPDFALDYVLEQLDSLDDATQFYATDALQFAGDRVATHDLRRALLRAHETGPGSDQVGNTAIEWLADEIASRALALAASGEAPATERHTDLATQLNALERLVSSYTDSPSGITTEELGLIQAASVRISQLHSRAKERWVTELARSE